MMSLCRAATVRAILVAAVPVLLAADLAPCAAQSSPFDDAFAWADSVLEQAVAEELVPGAVLLVARDGRVLHERAFGYAQLYAYGGARLAEPEPMTMEHVFDLASVTKVMATTMAVMLLVDRGRIDLDAPVHTYLPEFRGAHKDEIRVRDLLTHGAGLYQWLPTYYHARNGAEAYEYVRDLELAFPVGERRRYSDLGFMLLGYIVDRVSGQSLDVFLDQNLYGPLDLTSTAFNPRDRRLGPFAATSHGNPYERRMVEDEEFGYRVDEDPDGFRDWREYTLLGEVNDGNAYYAHDGVAGHAGLFSTASDLRVLLDLLLNDGVHEGRRIVGRATIAEFLRPQAFGNGLGWMVASGSGETRRPAGPFSHGGFTGTWVMGVPEHGLAIILLTNRQNLGVDEAGYYPDVGAVRRSIVERITQAAGNEADRLDHAQVQRIEGGDPESRKVDAVVAAAEGAARARSWQTMVDPRLVHLSTEERRRPGAGDYRVMDKPGLQGLRGRLADAAIPMAPAFPYRENCSPLMVPPPRKQTTGCPEETVAILAFDLPVAHQESWKVLMLEVGYSNRGRHIAIFEVTLAERDGRFQHVSEKPLVIFE